MARDRSEYSHNRTGRPAGRVYRKSCAGLRRLYHPPLRRRIRLSAGSCDRRCGGRRYRDYPRPRSAEFCAAPDVAAKDARVPNACVLSCPASACAGREAAEQAGKKSLDLGALRERMHAGAADWNACISCWASAGACACCTCRASIWICVEKRPIRQCRNSFRIRMRYIINGIS